MKNDEYIGVYDHKESNTFRPTLESRIHKDYPVSKTLTCREDSCCVLERERDQSYNLRIRKLTPKECMRLMGFSDEDYQAMKDCGMSDAAIYHCAGDSIVTTVIAYLLSPMLPNNNCEEKIENYIKEEITNN